MKKIEKPGDNEFQANEPMLANLIPNDGLLLSHLAANTQKTKSFVLSIPENKLMYRYAGNKWTIKEVLTHLIDMEHIYCYRMLRFSRNDQTILSGFNADEYVLYSDGNSRNALELISEFEAVRNATIFLLNGLTQEALLRSGNVNGYPVTVRALAYHIAGHELHHIAIIKERYLN